MLCIYNIVLLYNVGCRVAVMVVVVALGAKSKWALLGNL